MASIGGQGSRLVPLLASAVGRQSVGALRGQAPTTPTPTQACGEVSCGNPSATPPYAAPSQPGVPCPPSPVRLAK
jgi:hypothetical protein